MTDKSESAPDCKHDKIKFMYRSVDPMTLDQLYVIKCVDCAAIITTKVIDVEER